MPQVFRGSPFLHLKIVHFWSYLKQPGTVPLEDSLRSRDGFRDFRESVITLPILLIRFSVLDPFLRSRLDGLANDDAIDGDSSRFLVCFRHSVTRSLNGWMTPSKALNNLSKHVRKTAACNSCLTSSAGKNLPCFGCLRMCAIFFQLNKIAKYRCQVVQTSTSRVVGQFWKTIDE